jgi:hypothetical protein
MKTPSSRRPVLERAKSNKPPFVKTQRDDEILNLIYEFDYADGFQIEKLFFPADASRTSTAPSSQCIRRLEGLFHGGYVDRHRYYCSWKEGNYPLIYQCTPKGYEEVAYMRGVELSDLDIPPKTAITTNKYPHNKRVRDLRTLVLKAATISHIPLVHWIKDRTIRHAHEDDKVAVSHNGAVVSRSWMPDGIFTLQIAGEEWWFPVEVDMAHQSLDTWAVKLKTIMAYRQQGRYLARYGTTSQRNLIITTGEERLANLMKVAEEVEANTRFWFTIWDQVSEHTIFTGRIWRLAKRPKDELHGLIEGA